MDTGHGERKTQMCTNNTRTHKRTQTQIPYAPWPCCKGLCTNGVPTSLENGVVRLQARRLEPNLHRVWRATRPCEQTSVGVAHASNRRLNKCAKIQTQSPCAGGLDCCSTPTCCRDLITCVFLPALPQFSGAFPHARKRLRPSDIKSTRWAALGAPSSGHVLT